MCAVNKSGPTAGLTLVDKGVIYPLIMGACVVFMRRPYSTECIIGPWPKKLITYSSHAKRDARNSNKEPLLESNTVYLHTFNRICGKRPRLRHGLDGGGSSKTVSTITDRGSCAIHPQGTNPLYL